MFADTVRIVTRAVIHRAAPAVNALISVSFVEFGAVTHYNCHQSRTSSALNRYEISEPDKNAESFRLCRACASDSKPEKLEELGDRKLPLRQTIQYTF